jgi:DNA (cytosine-5)-methyltransferase 1
MSVPVIDLFAGPGGLGEGFSRCESVRFEVAVSIEKDGMAFETLQLRAAHRALLRSGADSATWATWDSTLESQPWNIVFEQLRESGNEAISKACDVARHEAWNLELGPENRDEAAAGIRQRLLRFMRGNALPENAVLIGGPPCQAYSVVGRSRNRGTDGYTPEGDHRHFLYLEYLRVIKTFRPAVFIMENVKGILSSRVADRQIFDTIRRDLHRPDQACGEDTGLGYVLVALPEGSDVLTDPAPDQYIVRAEDYGVPQARHRVIICGVRRDVFERARTVAQLRRSNAPTVADVIGDLPRLRPQLSFRGKGLSWLDSFDQPIMATAIDELRLRCGSTGIKVAETMLRALSLARREADPGWGLDMAKLDPGRTGPTAMSGWYRDRPLALLANHQSRSHMPSDLVRYLFVAAYGEATGESPRLSEFPVSLLPEHKNIDRNDVGLAIFKDRFRVQLADRFSMTVTSHIGKDGHAFIHPDAAQFRSLSAREAARLQTFPDSYVFLGNRTAQYTQVGNAVPPYLARQIADVVADVLKKASLAG